MGRKPDRTRHKNVNFRNDDWDHDIVWRCLDVRFYHKQESPSYEIFLENFAPVQESSVLQLHHQEH